MWFSSLEPAIGQEGLLDERSREAGLRPVRDLGYARVLGAVETVTGPLVGRRLLDIGSGHGWFLDAAAERGARTTGIEPDRAVAASGTARGLDVRVGYFPDDLPAEERYGVIALNDVFEHLPAPGRVLDAVAARLEPSGVVAISIPTSDGAAFRVARAACRVGVTGPFRRLWQHGLPSPHLWYFDEASLTRLLARHGFAILASGRLPSIARAGLKERIEADPRSGAQGRIAWAALWAAAPVLNRPRLSDAMWLLAKRAPA